MHSLKYKGSLLLILAVAGAAIGAAQSCPDGGLVAEQNGVLTPAGGASGDRFGSAVAADDATVVVGAHYSYASGGSAYAFDLIAGNWVPQPRLVGSDTLSGDFFGGALAIYGDTLVVAARGDDEVFSASGSVYVFSRSGSSWEQQTRLNANDPGNGDYLGQSVAVAEDTIAVGAMYDDTRGEDAGSVYVFVRDGAEWAQEKLVPADGEPGDYFGRSVALCGDTLLVGASSWYSDRGAAYVYVRAAGVWTQQAKLIATDAASGDNFGFAVALDGNTAVIGARADDLTGFADAGSAYVFVRSLDTGTWSEQAKLTAGDAALGDRFGTAVAVDGDTALIGADLDDHAGGNDAGAAYIFTRSGEVWTQQYKLGEDQALAGNHYGVSVALRSGVAVVGAEYAVSGKAFVYDVHCLDTDLDGVLDDVDNCPFVANPNQIDLDEDGLGDACDPDIDGDAVPNDADNCPALANLDQADLDLDGIGDACDPDIDNDTVPNAEDSTPRDRHLCRDADGDGCDDCSFGSDNPAGDGIDTDADGQCDLGDPDDDGDGVPDLDDPYPLNRFACGDLDDDECDDCNSGLFDPFEDGVDTDEDGFCDFGDVDDDADGVPDEFDPYPTNGHACGSVDGDECDDCVSGTFNELNDGPDFDVDGLCDASDADDDNDGLPDEDELTLDTDPLNPDSDDDGLLDGAEVDIAADPLDPDTDGDGLLDGSEVTAGTNPLSADTDDDGVDDREDPWPLEPGVPPAYLVTECRQTAAAIRAMDLSLFTGPTTNARKARRTALACGVTGAANAIAARRYFLAAVELECVYLLIDGCSWPSDWMPPSPQKAALRDVVEMELELTLYLLD